MPIKLDFPFMEKAAVRGITRAETVRERIAVAGYAAYHAPHHEQGHVGLLAMRMRTFDRNGGTIDLDMED